MHNSDSIIIDIKKPRTYAKDSDTNIKLKDKKQKRRRKPVHKTSADDMNEFTLPAIKPLSSATLKKDEFVLPYIYYSKRQEVEKLKYRKKMSCRDDYKAVSADLKRRLHVDDPPNECRTVQDFDPGFFSVVNGSVLSKYVAPYKSLKHLFNKQLMMREETGIRNDCMLNIDRNFKKEQKIYCDSVKHYLQQVKYFDEFMSSDYQKSMLSLSKWDEVKAAVHKQIYEVQCLAAKLFTITSQLIGLDYRYRLQQMYGRFLYYLSPPSWRYQHRAFAHSIEIEAKGFDFGNNNEDETFDIMFEKLKRECYSGLVKPVLYFNHHSELMNIFEGIAQQHLHHFVHVIQASLHTSALKKGIKLFRQVSMAQDSTGLLATIRSFETKLTFSETRCSQLQEKFFKILNGLFYESVGAPEVLKLHLHLEFCYEKIFLEKPLKMDIPTIARALEDFYLDYTKRLESITGDKIKMAVAQYVESERIKYKNAKIAARELRLFERLERTLLRAFAPVSSPQAQTYTVKRLSRRKTYSKQDDECKRILTEAELEYLVLFTDWTEQEDPADYLHVLEEQLSEHLSGNVPKI